MDRFTAALAVLTVYLAVGTLLAMVGRRLMAGRGESEFFIAGRRLGGRLSALNYATTTYSAFMVIGLVGFTYKWGVGSFGFEIVYFIATVGFLLVFSRRVWARARERGWISPGEMLADIYGTRLMAIVASVIYLVALIPYASAQLKGVGEAVAGMLGDEYYASGVALGLVLVLLWTLVAGMWSVATTNLFQALWIIAAVIGYVAWVYYKLASAGLGLTDVIDMAGREGLASLEGNWPLDRFLVYTLPWVFFAVINPHVVQRLYAPKDEASLAETIRWFSVYGVVYTVAVTMIGFMARAGVEAGVFPEAGGVDKVTPTLLSVMNPVLSAILFTSIIAEAVGTADAIILTLASSASRDLAGRLGERARRAVALATVLAASLAVAAVAGMRVGFIVDLSVLTSLMLLPLAPATIAGWAGLKIRGCFAVASVIAGFALPASYILKYRNPGAVLGSTPLGVPLPAWILAVSTAILLAGWRPRRDEVPKQP